MNELKQIRTMAEMILEKVDALEGVKPRPQNGFREFVPEVNPEQKFKVGQIVYYDWYDGTETKGVITQTNHSGNHLIYISQNSNQWVAPELLRVKPKATEPKFKVGDRVVGDMSSPMIGTIIKLATKEDWFTVLWSSGFSCPVHASRIRLATEDDREWHSGPPPHIGWWNASNDENPGVWRWWNGEAWSVAAYEGNSAEQVEHKAQTPLEPIWCEPTDIYWCDYWPENARVPRIDPDLVL